jgi:UDP-N-acetylglucosamine transferase subunit ALG13
VIFVTVGAQMPFDRLVRSVDEWADSHQREDIFAQIGTSSYRPRHIRHSQFIAPAEFRRHVERADVIVAHAGMGSIISAVELGKPILVMPRRGDLGETRNDHQVATAERFGSLRLIEVATNERELGRKLDEIVRLPCWREAARAVVQWAACPFSHDEFAACTPTAGSACPHLLSALHSFVEGRALFELVLPVKTSLLEQPAPVREIEPATVGVGG